jgi:hypothetical protein
VYNRIAKYLWRGSEVGNGKRKYFCSACSYTNPKSRKIALVHAKKHETSGEFKCRFCGRRLGSKCDLTKHVKSKHPYLSGSEEQAGDQVVKNPINGTTDHQMVEVQSQSLAGLVVDVNVIIQLILKH